MFRDEQSYYQHRAEVEAALATKAVHPEAAKAHRELAQAYLGKLPAPGAEAA